MSEFKRHWQRLKNSFLGLPRVVRGLILVQLAGWLVLLLAASGAAATMTSLLALVPGEFFPLRVWTALTYMFFHFRVDPFGLFFDIVMLWTLGGVFARRWRQSHFLFFYLAAGVVGGLVDLSLNLLVPRGFSAPVMGAAACSFALLTAFWLVLGESLVTLFNSPPFRGKWLFFGLLGLEFLFFLADANHQLGVQLGGVLAGWLMVTGRWRPGKFRAWATSLFDRLGRRGRNRGSRFRVVE